jgi:Ca2+-binding RTX toxin-like protein
VASLGISGSYNFIGGSDTKNDNFSHKGTKGTDAFCGFGGNDSIYTLREGDIFIGGAGRDAAGTLNNPVSGNYGTFNGGDGNDTVQWNTSSGTFNGDAGDDSVLFNYGIFNGGDGFDSVTSPNESTGTFNQDAL